MLQPDQFAFNRISGIFRDLGIGWVAAAFARFANFNPGRFQILAARFAIARPDRGKDCKSFLNPIPRVTGKNRVD